MTKQHFRRACGWVAAVLVTVIVAREFAGWLLERLHAAGYFG
jgi:hypothetical protein